MEKIHLPLPIPGFLKKRRRQDVLVLTGFSGMVDDSLEFVEGKPHAANHKTSEAWSIHEQNMIRDRKTGRPLQLVTAWNCHPIRLFGPDVPKQNIAAIAARVTDEAIDWEEKQQHKNSLVMWTGIVSCILSLGIVLPVLNAVFTGKLKLPFIG